MTGSDRSEEPPARNRQERYEFIKQWAEYVRTHPDDDWGEQVNRLVDAQLESARHMQGNHSTRDGRSGDSQES